MSEGAAISIPRTRWQCGDSKVASDREIINNVSMNVADATAPDQSHLAILRSNHGAIVAQHDSPERFAVFAHVGTAEPLHCTAVGMVSGMVEHVLKEFPLHGRKKLIQK
jgi:hypothetical protein